MPENINNNANKTNNKIVLTAKDYILVSIIGFSFAIFSIPILKNLDLPFIKIDAFFMALMITFFTVFAVFALWIASLIGRWLPVAFQFAKFGAVGAFNTFLDWGILNFLIAYTGHAGGWYFSSFKGFSFLMATLSAFFWNKYWTFESKQKTDTSEVGKFFAVSTMGLIINVSLASVVVFIFKSSDIVSPAQLANIGAATATIVSLLWNFVGYKLWVFKK